MREAANDFLQLLKTPEPAELGPRPRAGTLSQSALESRLAELFQRANLPGDSQQLVRALILLWHDHLDASHAVSQAIENADGSFIHAIMHRREPDYFNAEYWFRRVGKHPCFAEIARHTEVLLRSKDERDLVTRLIPGGEWDAFAFVDACEASARAGASQQRELLREIQRIEFEVLLQHLSSAGRV
jgi:hypothetical protein